MKIALCGKLRSGKDTVAAITSRKYSFYPYAFSEGIWEVIELLFPNEYKNRHKEKPRRLLSDLGQGIRKVEQNVWVNRTLKQILVDGNSNVVITDLRQPNELHELRKRGYKIVRISSDVETRIERAESTGDKFNRQDLIHETELFVDSFEVDYEIHNDSTLEELEAKVDEMIQIFKEEKYQAELKRLTVMEEAYSGGETI